MLQKSEYFDTGQLDLRLLKLFNYASMSSEVLLGTVVGCRGEKRACRKYSSCTLQEENKAVFGLSLSGPGKTDHS